MDEEKDNGQEFWTDDEKLEPHLYDLDPEFWNDI